MHAGTQRLAGLTWLDKQYSCSCLSCLQPWLLIQWCSALSLQHCCYCRRLHFDRGVKVLPPFFFFPCGITTFSEVCLNLCGQKKREFLFFGKDLVKTKWFLQSCSCTDAHTATLIWKNSKRPGGERSRVAIFSRTATGWGRAIMDRRRRKARQACITHCGPAYASSPTGVSDQLQGLSMTYPNGFR